MPRYKLTIEYDGEPFLGWQVQAASFGRTVQGALVEAFQKFCGETVSVAGAGRTDAGVHALGQVAHVDLTKTWPSDVVRDAVNAHLRPDPVAVLTAEPVPATFDARFSAVKRHYVYRIVDRRPPLTFSRREAWWVARKLDHEAMQAGADLLLGRHDFTTFRATECQAKSPVKTLDRLEVARQGEELVISCSARSFLHNQVRSMVGTLKLVGEGLWTVEDVGAALAARDRKACGTVAPAHGLYLARVDYPPSAAKPAA